VIYFVIVHCKKWNGRHTRTPASTLGKSVDCIIL